MNIEIKTDPNGHEIITLVDVPKYGARPKGIHTKNILIRACDGEVFNAPPFLPGLSRLGAPDCPVGSNLPTPRPRSGSRN